MGIMSSAQKEISVKHTFFLPVVDSDLFFPINAEVEQLKNDAKFVKKMLHKIKKENPNIAKFITRFASEQKNSLGVAICGLMVYHMLESQAEVDKMEEEFT